MFRRQSPRGLFLILYRLFADVHGGEWQTVTDGNKAGFRFFKVVVELP